MVGNRIESTGAGATAPPPGTVEAWCFALVTGTELEPKLRPPAPPALGADASWELRAPARRDLRPGRPAALRVTTKSPSTPRGQALRDPAVRARLVHTFLHHELQAAELFAWGVLAFPDAPRELRRGFARLCQEELAHLSLYERQLARLGAAVGDFPVRDWFWERVPRCEDALQFVALVGVGLEGANLEHSQRFAEAFRAVGDDAGAAVLERVEREEVAHVAFATKWFRRLAGEADDGAEASAVDYERWSAALPPPLTPSLLRGRPLNRPARRAAGLDEAFLAALERAPATSRSRGRGEVTP